MSEPPTVLENRVRFAETDLHGHVFFGDFFTCVDETFDALLRRIDYPYDRMHAEGWTTNVVHTDFDCQAPAACGDVLCNRMRIDSIGERSVTTIYQALAGGGTLAVGFGDEGGTEGGSEVDDGDGAAVRVPNAFREAVAEFQDEPS